MQSLVLATAPLLATTAAAAPPLTAAEQAHLQRSGDAASTLRSRLFRKPMAARDQSRRAEPIAARGAQTEVFYARELYHDEVESGHADRYAEDEKGKSVVVSEMASMQLFRRGEWHLDGFAAITSSNESDKDGVGAGTAITYYPHRNFGFGVEYMGLDDFRSENSFAAMAHLRAPLDTWSTAFDFFGGIGATTESSDTKLSLHIGAGAEVRLLQHLGAIVGFRYVEVPDGYWYYTFTAGLRYVF